MRIDRQRGLLAILLCLDMAWASATDFLIVAGADSGIGKLTRQQVADVFLGKTSRLPGVTRAVLIDQPESNPLREDFYLAITGRSAAQAKSNWAKLAFTGKGMPPVEGASNEDIKKRLAGNRNMLGYIERSALDDNVKVVFAP